MICHGDQTNAHEWIVIKPSSLARTFHRINFWQDTFGADGSVKRGGPAVQFSMCPGMFHMEPWQPCFIHPSNDKEPVADLDLEQGLPPPPVPGYPVKTSEVRRRHSPSGVRQAWSRAWAPVCWRENASYAFRQGAPGTPFRLLRKPGGGPPWKLRGQ